MTLFLAETHCSICNPKFKMLLAPPDSMKLLLGDTHNPHSMLSDPGKTLLLGNIHCSMINNPQTILATATPVILAILAILTAAAMTAAAAAAAPIMPLVRVRKKNLNMKTATTILMMSLTKAILLPTMVTQPQNSTHTGPKVTSVMKSTRAHFTLDGSLLSMDNIKSKTAPTKGLIDIVWECSAALLMQNALLLPGPSILG